MQIMWISPLVQNLGPPVPGSWEPGIQAVRRVTGMFPCRWSATDAIRSFKYAIGVAEVDTIQLAAVKAVTEIRVFESDQWFLRFNQLLATERTKINQFCTGAGIALPTNAEVVRDMCSRINQIIDNKTIDDLLAEMALP